MLGRFFSLIAYITENIVSLSYKSREGRTQGGKPAVLQSSTRNRNLKHIYLVDTRISKVYMI